MSQSPEAKAAYAVRRELRLSRQKIAAQLMPWCLQFHNDGHGDINPKAAAILAVVYADLLLAELQRTEKDSP